MTERPGRGRIGIDGYNMALTRGTGVATYGRTLSSAIHQLGFSLDLLCGLDMPRKTPAELRETLFYGALNEEVILKNSWRRSLRRAFTMPSARSMEEIPLSGNIMSGEFADRLPQFERLFNLSGMFNISARYFRRYRRFMPVRMDAPPAVMHWTYPVPLTVMGARNIYTLHDLVPLRLPHTTREDKRYYDMLVRACVRNADHVITVSEASKQDIVSMLGADPERVTNTYQSTELPPARPKAELSARLASLFDLEADGYFLFFGAIEPKKNVGRLIEAYLESGVTTPLMLVGADGWHVDQELRLLRGAHGTKLSASARIRRIEYLPRTMLFDLVRGAKAVLFPSLYEGFGLPALEALGCGVPVLTSNAGSLPEVVGGASITVDPYDIQAIAAGIRNLDHDPQLRAQLSAKGLERFAAFDMSNFCNSINSVYRAILER